jgi:hypothetical protein
MQNTSNIYQGITDVNKKVSEKLISYYKNYRIHKNGSRLSRSKFPAFIRYEREGF